MPLTVQDLMDKMPEAFVPEKAGDTNATIQFKLGGEGGGEWYVAIADGTCQVEKGTHENPTMTLSSEASDYIDIITGNTDAMKAFMQGKVKLAGDLNLAMKMMNFFKL